MHPLLKNFLDKIGVKDYLDLTSEEKESFRELAEGLEGRPLTDPDVRLFLVSLLNESADKLAMEPSKYSKEDKIYYAMQYRLLKKLIAYMDSPKVVKAQTELELETRIQQTTQ